MNASLAPAANVLFLLVCSSTLSDGQTDVETRATEASQALIKAHVAWKTKLSSPGASPFKGGK